jgi:hypothetical protein
MGGGSGAVAVVPLERGRQCGSNGTGYDVAVAVLPPKMRLMYIQRNVTFHESDIMYRLYPPFVYEKNLANLR